MFARQVPFVGRTSYCYSKCLCMIFRFFGDFYELPFVECVTTVPFGFVYMPYEKGGFAVNGYNPHDGVKRALNTLRYRREFKCFRSSHEALFSLKKELQSSPVLLGPLDMGFLPYDPFSRFKKGSDHYLVALGVEKDHVIVHDPDGYFHVPIRLEHFLRAWKAEAIEYKKGSYSMWIIKQRMEEPPIEAVYKNTLLLGLRNLREKTRSYLRKKHDAHLVPKDWPNLQRT